MSTGKISGDPVATVLTGASMAAVQGGVNVRVPASLIPLGTVTTASVVSANGLAGTVANPTTTPALTISTTVTGVLKGSAGAFVAAVNSDLPAMTATVGGAVPTPPNNTTTFLRGDGTFAAPSSGGTVTNTSGNLTASAVMVGNGTADAKVLASLGTTTTVLHGNAAGLPTFGAVSLTADVSGTLPVANGGTGAATLAANNVVLGNGTSAVQLVAPGTSGNVLTSNGSTWNSAANPAAGRTLLATLTTTSGSTQTTSAFASTYSALELEIDGVNWTGSVFSINIGSDGGSTFDTAINVTSGTAAGAYYGKAWISRTALTGNKVLVSHAGVLGNANMNNGHFATKTSPTNCIQLACGTAFTAGAVYVYGVP